MKEELLIDMSGIMDKETFHEYVSKKFNFPGYYGYNLDALWDCIIVDDQSSMPQKLIVEGLAALKGFLPELYDGFVECLQDYAKEYPDREVMLRQDSPSGEGIEFEDEF
jgi:RNAse (barnase) inhibitor barstar